MPQQLTETDYEHMRILLAQHDSEAAPATIYDLNNPPKEQYRHKKFPMMVYDLTNSTPAKHITIIVHSEKELALALENGWSLEGPEFREEVMVPLKVSLQVEADQVDAKLRKRA